jgi:WD40 repeat protein
MIIEVASLLAVPTDGRRIPGRPRGWDLRARNPPQEIGPRVLKVPPGQAAFSVIPIEGLPDDRLVSGGLSGTLRMWDTFRHTPTVFAGPTSPVHGLAALPGGRLVCEACKDGTVRAWACVRYGRDGFPGRSPRPSHVRHRGAPAPERHYCHGFGNPGLQCVDP